MTARELQTTAEVIQALGGYRAIAKITGRKDGAASNWGRFETFPANTYVAIRTALAERGLSAPDRLWGMKSGEAAA